MMVVKASSWRRSLTATSLAFGLSLSWLTTAVAQSISGVVTSFGLPAYRRYFEEYSEETGVKVNYAVRSSAGSIERFIDESVDFIASDAPPTGAERERMSRGLLLLSTVGNGVAVIYNLREAPPDIKISRETLVKIFTGKIGNWNQVSPRLPNRKIQVVVHGEGSGTNFIFTRHLRALTDGEIKATKDPEWGFNVFASRDGDAAVASAVALNNGAIGYVEANYALSHNLSTARLQNKKGEYVRPTVDESHKALLTTEWDENFTLLKIDDPDEGYPIIGTSMLIFYQKYPNAEIAQAIKDFVSWVTSRGPEINTELFYVALSPSERPRLRDYIHNNITISP
ncbi:MAG: extracellular solute-binding protein [Hormoscilla sp. GUM202]|nr:extracellular solute-binding protein [Hormoscilla sp. GUM202]